MQIEQSTSGAATVLTISGDLDSFSVNYLKERLARLFEENHFQIIINLSSVEFVDSAGLGQLVAALRMCFNKNGDLVLVGVNPTIGDLLRITKLDTVFKVFGTVDEAAAVFGPDSASGNKPL